MDFWQQQDHARKSTKSLIVYLGLSILAIIVSIYVVVAALFPMVRSYADSSRRQQNTEYRIDWWEPEILLWVAGITGLIVGGASVVKLVELSGGGAKVAEMLGGRLLNPSTTDPHELQLQNVVEEMAIASGTPVPAIYILPNETSINAFAAGTSVDTAAIGVTRGCMELLNRDELQGVIAHEFSHILNGDMKLNIRLIGILAGIVGIAFLGRILLESGRFSRDKNSAPVFILGLALLIIGGVGLLCGRLIKAAVSRQREFLADASAVQFTRNPDGIAGALKKIGGLAMGSHVQTPKAEEASHMFFGNSARSSWLSSFATHPPLADRIHAIDPSFDGKFPRVEMPAPVVPKAKVAPQRKRPSVIPGFTDSAVPIAAVAAASADEMVGLIGKPTRIHLDHAAQLLDELPTNLRTAAHEPFSACALVYGILIGDSDHEELLKDFAPKCHPAVLDELRKLLPETRAIDDAMKLPLIDLALPALKLMSRDQFDRFKENVSFLIEHDRQIDLFEYALDRIVLKSLQPEFEPTKPRPIQYYSVKPLAEQCAIVLSALADIGHPERDRAEVAFKTGARQLCIEHSALRYLELGSETLTRVDEALDRLAESSPPVKKIILTALAHTAAADGTIALRERELLRAIAETLDCPIPPHVDVKG